MALLKRHQTLRCFLVLALLAVAALQFVPMHSASHEQTIDHIDCIICLSNQTILDTKKNINVVVTGALVKLFNFAFEFAVPSSPSAKHKTARAPPSHS